MDSDLQEKITKIEIGDKSVYSIIDEGEELSLPEYSNKVYKNPAKWGW